MKHTPGPWTYEKGLGCKTISGQDYDIADTVGLDNESGGEDEANARLITTTPDLVAALESIINSNAKPVYGIGGKAIKGFTLYLPKERYEQAKQAIARTKGG